MAGTVKCREQRDPDHAQADEICLTWHHVQHKLCGPKGTLLCCTVLCRLELKNQFLKSTHSGPQYMGRIMVNVSG